MNDNTPEGFLNGMQIRALPSTLLLGRSDWRLVRVNAGKKAGTPARCWSEAGVREGR